MKIKISEMIGFDKCDSNPLSPEAREIKRSSGPTIRRRIAWLGGKSHRQNVVARISNLHPEFLPCESKLFGVIANLIHPTQGRRGNVLGNHEVLIKRVSAAA